jgi:hypothetical protein
VWRGWYEHISDCICTTAGVSTEGEYTTTRLATQFYSWTLSIVAIVNRNVLSVSCMVCVTLLYSGGAGAWRAVSHPPRHLGPRANPDHSIAGAENASHRPTPFTRENDHLPRLARDTYKGTW